MAYLTLAEAREYIGLSSGDSTADDALISSFIEAATTFINEQTSFSFESVTATRYYREEDTYDRVLTLDRPILTVTTLTNGNGAELGSSAYWLLPRNVTPQWYIELKSSYSWLFDIDGWASVAGTWGYVATVPSDVKMATRELVNLLYKGKDKSTLGTASAFVSGGSIVIREGLPPFTKQVLATYREYL